MEHGFEQIILTSITQILTL